MSIRSDFTSLFGVTRYNRIFSEIDVVASNYFGCAFKINQLVVINESDVPYSLFPCNNYLDTMSIALLTQGSEANIYHCERYSVASRKFEPAILKVMRTKIRKQMPMWEWATIEGLKKMGVKHVIDILDSFDYPFNGQGPLCTHSLFAHGGTSIASLIKSGKKFTIDEIQDVAFQILETLDGLKKVFTSPVVHCNLCTTNILLGEKGVSVSDWIAVSFPGAMRFLSDSNITLSIRTPEQLMRNSTFDASVDIWGLGCCLVEMATGKPPFPGNDEGTVLQSIMSVLKAAPAKFDFTARSCLLSDRLHVFTMASASLLTRGGTKQQASLFYDLIYKMLKRDHRITPEEALEHNFFKKLETPRKSDFESMLGDVRYNHVFREIDVLASNYFGCAFTFNDLVAKNRGEVPYYPFPCSGGIDYLSMTLLAKGGDGEVYRCERFSVEEGKFHPAIMKFVDFEKGKAVTLKEADEIRFLKANGVKHVIELLDTGVNTVDSFVYYVFADGGTSIRDLIKGGKQFTLAEIKRVTFQLCEFLRGLKKCNPQVVHCDLSSQNVLLGEKNDISVIDFSSARPPGAMRDLIQTKTTLEFRSREQLMECPTFDTNVDMWSFGCILVEMATGKTPFKGKDNKEVLNSIIESNGLFQRVDDSLVVKGATRKERLGFLKLISSIFKETPRLTPEAALEFSLFKSKK